MRWAWGLSTMSAWLRLGIERKRTGSCWRRSRPSILWNIRGRIEEILDSAKVLKQREGENPARWRGHLKHLLPEPSKVAPVKHFPALPYERMGEFMADLRRKEESVGRLATEFTILTNLRTG